MIIIANFTSTQSIIIHSIGGYVTLYSIVIYSSIETWISYRMIPITNTLRTARIRLICTIISFVSFILLNVSALKCIFQVNSEILIKLMGPSRLFFIESSPFHFEYVFTAIFEIIMLLMATPFFASFIYEFNRFKLFKGQLIFDKN